MVNMRRGLWGAIGVVVLWLIIGGPLGSLQSKVSEVQKNDNAAVPAGAAPSRPQCSTSNKKFVAVRVAPRRWWSTAATAG